MVRYPEHWQDAAGFVADLAGLLDRAEFSWLQACLELSFCLSQVVLAEEDTGRRLALAEVLADKLLEAARTGRLPGEWVQ
jgi:hypothetical protein